MADGGLTVIDGSQLRSGDLRLPIPAADVSGARILELAELEAAARLFNLSLPDSLKSAALRRLDGGTRLGFLSENFDDAWARKKIQDYLLALADELQDDPLVVSVLDGSALRLFLDDEDDFAMLAENLFTDLDIGDKGKLNKNEIRNALAHMGVEMGVPPFSESDDLLSNILKKHGAEGEEQLGQAQFAQLLQPILQDLADALAERHVTVIQNIKVVNGSRLKKILGEETVLDEVIKGMFQACAIKSGEGNKEKLRSFLDKKGLELGLPPFESNEAVALLYIEIFSSITEEKFAGDTKEDAFQSLVKHVFKKFTQELEENPVFIDLEG